MPTELPTRKLRMTCGPDLLSCDSSEDLPPLDTIVGQQRAVRSLRFGLGIKNLGFNIYVAGVPGTGRTTAVKRFLDEVAAEKEVPSDWCYVNDFQDPYRPNALRLPAGRATEFQEDMRVLVEAARKEIRGAFESEEYAAQREETVKSFQQQRQELLAQVNEMAQREGFVIQSTPMGLLTIPVLEGKPLAEEEFQTLTPEEQEAITQKRDRLQTEIKAALRQARALEKQANEALKILDREVALYALSPLIQEVKEDYAELPEVILYLDQVREDMLENLAPFRQDPEADAAPSLPTAPAGEDHARKYEVNALVDNSELDGAPVVIELNPIYNNLFGRVEKEAHFGALTTDLTLIREGSLHRANGGYLVLPAEELLRNPLSWDSLKRALRNQEIVIEEAGERLGFMSTKSLRPEPIPLDVKVVLIGQPLLYHLLYSADEDFGELFKVKADFDTRMELTKESVRDYVAFVCTLCEEEGLRHLDRTALARLIEHGARLAGEQDKLSTRFGELSDVIREASHYAVQQGAPMVTAAQVRQAIEERFYRSSLVQERIQEAIERGTVMIDVEGEAIGQVNGLSVLSLGDIDFGRPNRITASIGLGRDGLIDIEREAKLGGPLHTKGVMILSGYLATRYAQDKPLSLSARLVFEQSYGGVEGDSASSAELYAILSALSALPIRQGIAVTGSVNQMGEVQAIGGVNEKIEGFFAVCQARGMTGQQGVVIPATNVNHLMLKEEVVEAVEQGLFHIWAVDTIDEGIEVLTGVPAGAWLPDGTYEEGSVNDRVNRRLDQLAELMAQFGEDAEEAASGE